jgi:hypothetical protein
MTIGGLVLILECCAVVWMNGLSFAHWRYGDELGLHFLLVCNSDDQNASCGGSTSHQVKPLLFDLALLRQPKQITISEQWRLRAAA